MNRRILFISLLAAFLWVGCSESKSSPSGPVPKAPAELAKGEALFNTHCARCHGEGAKGTNRGPTFFENL